MGPVITLLGRNLFGPKITVPEVSYNETFLSLCAIYTCMTSFRKEGIGSFEMVSALQQKICDLRI